MIRKTFAAALFTSAIALGVTSQAQAQALTPDQADAVRKVVREYLMEHPEVIVDAMEALREKMNAQAETDAKKAVIAHKETLYNGKDDPVSGNPKGDVTVVEFFDYNCGYCKLVTEPMTEAVKTDGKVKVVYKEFPILGEDSMTAARVALAAKKQGKYDEVHRAFMKFRGKLDEKAIFRLAGEAGANVDQLKKEMMAPEIDVQIKKNIELAHALNIGSTPTFVVGDRILPGAMEGQVFKQLFDITRKGGRLDGAK